MCICVVPSWDQLKVQQNLLASDYEIYMVFIHLLHLIILVVWQVWHTYKFKDETTPEISKEGPSPFKKCLAFKKCSPTSKVAAGSSFKLNSRWKGCGYPSWWITIEAKFLSRCSHVWCRLRRFDSILLVFFRRWGRLVMRDLMGMVLCCD